MVNYSRTLVLLSNQHSLFHDLDLSAPAISVLGVQLEAAKFHSYLLSGLLPQTQVRKKN